MFWKKERKINHLYAVINMRDEEKKALRRASDGDKKRIMELLRENVKLKHKIANTENALMKRIADVEQLEAELEGERFDFELNEKALAKDAREKRQKVYKACAKMREIIRWQNETIATFQHNMQSLLVTYEQSEKHNTELNALTKELMGKLTVYEEIVGELKDNE